MANDTLEFEAVPSKPEMEFEFVPVPSKTSRRLTPSTTSTNRVDLDLDLEGFEFTPTGEEILQTDDELYERIESDMTYKPTDAELDKFLEYKSKQPKYALDLIKGVWHGGKAVVGDLAKGVWGAVKDPELMLSPTPTGMLKRGATLAEGAARATWDLGTVGRYINDWFSEQGDREYREEVEDMKLRQSNPDWKMDGAMGAEGYLSKEQKEEMRKSWATSYIEARIKEDLQSLEETTNNFKDSDLKRDFDRSGLEFVDGETRNFYTSPEYINNVLSPKQRDKYYEEFPKWINKRRRDRWRRGRYLMRTTELARRGETTVLGELFGPKVDEAAKAFVNSDVATLASYAGGPAEAGAVLSTKLARKSATSPSALAGKATEKAGKATQWAGGKVKQFGEWATTSPEKSAAVGAALGVASGDDSLTVLGGVLGGLAEQKVKVVPTAGEMLQKAGTAVEAIGEAVAKPEGVEGLLKSASRVAKDEGVAETLNNLSLLDPAINVAGDLGKGAAVGSAFGGALTLPSGDPEVIGSGIGAGGVGGFAAAAPGRYLTKGPRLKEQLQNEWSEFQKQLTPEQLKNIKEYAPTLEEMGNVITTLRMVNGVTRGGGNIDFKILSPTDFAKSHGVQRGVVVTKNKTRPSIEINAGYKGPNSLYHEAWHALKRFAGETEIQKTPDGKQEVAVLRPHLEQIQSILFGKKLEGKTVTEGLFKEKDLIGGFYDQYTSKMAPEERAAFQKQFELGEDGKKLTPAEADQKKLNYMMEEVEAESFRYLMSNTNPRQIAQGNRSLHQRFIDHMLLSEHSKTLRGMRKALETVGIDFKPSGQPSDIFMQKGQGITNSRELNAALRQYLRAWEGMQHRTRVMGDLEPSGFSIGGTGKAGRAQVEYHLSKKENDFLRDHFSSSDMLKKNKDGGVYYDPDGRVTLLTEGEIKKLQENRSEQIREKLSETDDGTGMVMMENGSFEGIPSPHQLDAIDRISNEIITPNQKQIIRETAEIMRNDPGAPIQFLYNAALGKGKTYSSSLSSTHRTAVPLGFHISKAQNFYFTSLDLGAYHRKISAWGDPTKKALHKGGHKLALWDKDVRAFEADLFNYLDNHKHGRKGAEGLDPDAQVAEMKRNVLNDFFDINRNKEEHGNFNPVTAARRAIDPKTGKQKKRAYRGLENLIRSYRLDRVLDENFGKSFSYALGKAIPMKSGAAFHEGQRKNLMPPPAPETPQFKRFFEGSKVVDAEGKPLVVYSGHGNAQLWGTKWDKQKGTAGAFYSTEDPAIASSYARGKMGNREYYQNGEEYRFQHKNGKWGKKIWQIDLTPEQQAKANEYLKEIGYDITEYWKDNSRYDVEARRALLTGGVRRLSNIHKFMAQMGDADFRSPNEPVKFAEETPSDPNVRAMQDLENQGTTRFEDLLDHAGIKWDASDFKRPGVFPMYLSIKNPLDASKPFPKEVLADLKKAASRERIPEGDDYTLEWTRDLPLRRFVEKIEETFGGVAPNYWSTQVPTKAKKIFQKHGYDGIKELGNKSGEGERQVNWIAFEPEQIKSALNKGEFSPESPDIRFMPAPTFYSKAERAVEASQQKTMSVDQAVSLATKGIPKAEYEWSGVVDWLEGRKEEAAEMSGRIAGGRTIKEDITNVEKTIGFLKEELSSGKIIDPFSQLEPKELDPITRAANERALASYSEGLAKLKRIEAQGHKVSKAELLEFLQNKGVKVEEVARGQISTEGQKLDAEIGKLQKRITEKEAEIKDYWDLAHHTGPDDTATVNSLNKRQERLDVELETLRLLQENQLKAWEKLEKQPKTLFKPDEYFTMLPGDEKAQQSYGELVLTLPEGKTHETFELPSSHRFPESNILAHIRFTERVDADGKKMLFIEELQSDWSNTGRNDGWKQERPAKVQKEIRRLKEEQDVITRNDQNAYANARTGKMYWGSKGTAEWDAIDKRILELEEKYPSNYGGAPDMPFKGDNRYGALALKRMIRWASDNGFDRLGWITGKDTAERYNLSKHVDEVKYFPETETLIASKGKWGTDSYQRLVDKRDITPDQLEAHLGKDIAKKLLDSPLQEGPRYKSGRGGAHTLAGDDLAIGGQWAETLYDKVLPTQAKKIVKKKGAVGRTRLEGEKYKKGGRKGRYEANYVDITPEVKALAEEGFSYFMPPGGGKGRAAAPAQPVTSLPATPIMPKVKLTDEEKEDSRRLLNLLKEKGI